MSTAELALNGDLAKTQGQFEGENQSGVEDEVIGEINEAAESQGLEQMGIEADQEVSQTLESSQAEIGKEFDVIAHYEAAYAEDIGAAKKEGDNILAQNEQDAQETKMEIKSAVDLAKESSKGQMTELEKKWANESGETKAPEQNAEVVEAPPVQEKKPLKTNWEIASEKLKAMDQAQNNENAANHADNKTVEDIKDDENAPVKRFIKISPNILGKDAPIQVEKNNASAAQDSEKRYIKISKNILGEDAPIDLSERGEMSAPEAPKQEDVKAEEDKYKPRDSKFIKISENILGKESPSNNEREKIPDQLMKEAAEVFEKIPDNEKRGFFKGIGALGFKGNELKGRFFKKIFGEMAKKANDWTEKGEQSLAARLCSSYADIYQGVEDQAKVKQDQLYSQKGGVLNVAAGVGALAGNALLYGRMVADITYANPLRSVTTASMFLGRGGEAMKEAHLKSHEVIDKGRAQDEDEAYDQAMVLYEQAKEKTPDGKVSAENLSKIYKENLPKDLLNRIDKNQGKEGICSRIAQKIAKADIEYSLKKIDKQIKSVESNDDLSPSAKAAAKNKILKKYDKFLKDMDRLVADSGKVDMIAYGSRLTEKGGKAAASFMALETLAEGIASGAEALAALPSGESDSLPEFSFQESDAEFDPAGATLEDGIIMEEAPIETDAEIINSEIAESAEPAENAPIENIPDVQPEPIAVEHDDYNLKVDALKNAGFSQEDLNQLSADDIKSFTTEQIRQHALENQINADFDAHTERAGFRQFDTINNNAEMEHMKNNLPKDSFETEPATQSESGSDQVAQAGAAEEKIIGEEGEVVVNEYSKETIYDGKASDIQEPKVVAEESFTVENVGAVPQVEAQSAVSEGNIKIENMGATGLVSGEMKFSYDANGNPIDIKEMAIFTTGSRGTEFMDMSKTPDLSRVKGITEQLFRDNIKQDGANLNKYIEGYKSLQAQGENKEANIILKHIAKISDGIESKYGAGVINRAKLLEALKK